MTASALDLVPYAGEEVVLEDVAAHEMALYKPYKTEIPNAIKKTTKMAYGLGT
jgi:hypothetical protein